MTTETITTKICSVCGVAHPATTEFFSARKGYKYGLDSRCKRCAATANAERYAASREKEAERQKKYRADNREKLAERKKKYYAANREKRAERDKKYYEANPEKLALKNLQTAQHMKMRRANPDERMRAEAWPCTKDMAEIYARRDRLQAEFGLALEVDHIVPERGDMVCGLNVLSNLQIIPAYMNRYKLNKFVTGWE